MCHHNSGFEDYFNTSVRARILEFLGGSSVNDVSSVYISTRGSGPSMWYDPQPVENLWRTLGNSAELARSLWDRKAILAHLDIEYVNFDHPAEAYLDPERTFELQRPVVYAIQEVLLKHRIAPLHLLSGRGHHFVWKIDFQSPAFWQLHAIGQLNETLVGRYSQPHFPTNERISEQVGRAFSGLGQVLEYVAHKAIDRAAAHSRLPIELTAVEAGPRERGREIVSIDLSEYGDPLSTRTIRMPFSAYLKPHHHRELIGEQHLHRIPVMYMIPCHEMDETRALSVMRTRPDVVELSRRASVQIPEQSTGMESLVHAYRQSSLADCHRYFYSANHDSPECWPATYDRTPLEGLTPCVQRMLQHPNELLLKPACIQHIVRLLLGLGWHPRHIGGLIRSKYERDYGWGDTWYRYDAATRADFYVRLFFGLIATGRDSLVDFNCRSLQEKGYCPGGQCASNLDPFRDRLVQMRSDPSNWRV